MRTEKNQVPQGSHPGSEEMGRLANALQIITVLLTAVKIPDITEFPDEIRSLEGFRKLYDTIVDMRELSNALGKGDLQKFVYSKGFVISNLKALQSNLRHLTWHTKKVAEGDFSQRVDFLGDFSDSFNEMAKRLEESSNQLRQLASIDALTQVANRLTLEQFMTMAYNDAVTNHMNLSILMFDIDHFKQVNDTFGHAVGDRVLVETSKVLGGQFRTTDMFARYGGEEFVAVLPGTGVDNAVFTARRANQAVAENCIDMMGEPPLRVTISVGISCIRADDRSYEDIILRSDTALYEAKRNGRNQVCVK